MYCEKYPPALFNYHLNTLQGTEKEESVFLSGFISVVFFFDVVTLPFLFFSDYGNVTFRGLVNLKFVEPLSGKHVPRAVVSLQPIAQSAFMEQ